MKFTNLPKAQRVHIANRVAQLQNNLTEYDYAVTNLKNRLAEAEYQVDKTAKELQKLRAFFEDSAKMGL